MLFKSLMAGGAVVMLAACVSAPDPHPLEGSEWQLAAIHTSGSTTTLTPALQARHTLAFGPDGALAMQLDCNRGRASWSAGKPRNGAGTITIGPVASAMLIAEMPEIGTITGEEAAALTGLAPVAHDSGTLRGKRAIARGRRALRHVMF